MVGMACRRVEYWRSSKTKRTILTLSQSNSACATAFDFVLPKSNPSKGKKAVCWADIMTQREGIPEPDAGG